MRMIPVMAMVIGAGALGFAAASQAGISLSPAQAQQVRASDEGIDSESNLPTCHIEKTLKYDFSGNPYMKKVRICA